MRRASGISFDGLAGSVSAQLLRVLDQMCGVVPNRSLRRSEVRSSHRISKIPHVKWGRLVLVATALSLAIAMVGWLLVGFLN
jgi:hypothetical protein